MNRRTLTMNRDGLEVEEEEDSFFESCERLSSAAPLDLASGPDDDDDDEFEDSRMSFVASNSIKRIYSIQSIARSTPVFPCYDMWMAEPGDVKERRKRLLQGMGLASNKDFLKLASTKVVRTISRRPQPEPKPKPKPKPKPDSAQVATAKVDSSPNEESKGDEPEPEGELELELEPEPESLPEHSTAIVLVRSRSDGDIDVFSTKTKHRKEELIGPVSKQRITRTSSGQLVPTIGVCQYTTAVKLPPKREKNKSLVPNSDVSQAILSDDAFGSFFLIKNLDTGKDFIVKGYTEDGMWNKVNDLQTGQQLTLEEFEKSVGYSPVVKELMRRASRNMRKDGGKGNPNSYLCKSFRNSKRMGAEFLKNIKGVANSVKLLAEKEEENSPPEDQKLGKNASQWVDVHQQGKSYKEFTALHLAQEIQVHEGSIWTMKFSLDARFLASAGEDRVIHVWEIQECEVMSTKSADDLSSASGTPVPPISERPPLAEITPMPSEMRRKGRTNPKKGNSIPDYVNMPETVVTLSEKPVCTFEGHTDDILDLAWSKSQQLLSSSMDKTVRMWDLETKSCLKIFTHNDYVTSVQFNPVDEDYFISGSLDGKVRIWSIPNRQVVDWTDIDREMVTAVCYTPDAQGAIVGTQEGCCRMYGIEDSRLEHRLDIQKKKPPAKKFPAFQSQAKKIPGFQASTPQVGKITGFQFAPWNPSEVLISSTDSRIGIYNGPELIQKFKGFRNTGSQISGSFTPDGRHVISASEDSQVYIWKVEECKNLGAGKKRTPIAVNAHEHFLCKDVSVAIPWPGSTKNEPPVIELNPKKQTKSSSAPPTPNTSLTREDNSAGANSKSQLPPLPKKKNASDKNTNASEKNTSCADEDSAEPAPSDPATGTNEPLVSSSASIKLAESPSISASSTSPAQSGDNGSSNGGQTVQATAWGMVIATASLEGEIRVYQNFGLPLKVSRQALLF